MREKRQKEDERAKVQIEKYLEELCERVARQEIRDQQRDEKAKQEAARQAEVEARKEERLKKQREVEAELEARRKERELERQKREEEKEYASKMRHMLKVRALEERRLVHVTLSTGPPPEDGGEPASVHIKLTMPTNVTSVSRLADGITRLMTEYDYTNKSEQFKKGHRWMQLLDSIELGLQRNIGERFAVRSSCGCGGWAKVPWIAVSDPSESTQHGLYLQYLFRSDMSAVYLCLGQGTSKLKTAFGPQAANRHLAHVGEFVREKCRDMVPEGHEMTNLDLSGSIQLRAGSQGLGADYERGSVISRIYHHGEPLSERTLLDELDEMVQIYEAVLSDERYINEIKAPIDQALFDAGHLKDNRKRKLALTDVSGGGGTPMAGGPSSAAADGASREDGSAPAAGASSSGGGGLPAWLSAPAAGGAGMSAGQRRAAAREAAAAQQEAGGGSGGRSRGREPKAATRDGAGGANRRRSGRASTGGRRFFADDDDDDDFDDDDDDDDEEEERQEEQGAPAGTAAAPPEGEAAEGEARGGKSGAWWLEDGGPRGVGASTNAASRGPRAKKQRTDAGPPSGGRGATAAPSPAAAVSAAPSAAAKAKAAAKPRKAPTSARAKGAAGGGGAGRESAAAKLARMTRDWPVGSRCEVMQEDEGYDGAWFAATVRKHAPPDRLVCEYDELLEGDDEDPTAPKTQYVGEEPAHSARPIPKPVADREAWEASLAAGASLQLFYDGGWWDVVVIKVVVGGGGGGSGGAARSFTVKPLLYDIEHVVAGSELRPKPSYLWDLEHRLWKQALGPAELGGSGSPERPSAQGGAAGAAAGGEADEVLEAQGEVEVDVEMDSD